MADRLCTSQDADEYITSLRRITNLDKSVIARLAFTYSLNTAGKNVAESKNFAGGEMRIASFMGGDETFVRTLVSFVYQKSEFDEQEFYSNHSIIKNHIDNGAEMLWNLYHQNGDDVNRWYAELVKIIKLSNKADVKTKDLDIFIGRNILNNDELIMGLNDTTIHANSHLAIMGIPGVGKTQFLLKILADIRRQSDYQTNFIYFDYKGDVVDNQKFIDTTRCRTYKLLQGEDQLPISPFILSDYSEQSILLSAREKAESFSSIKSSLGVVQKGALTDAIVAGYQSRQGTDKPFPDFNDILEIAKLAYETDNKKDDSLIEVLRDLAKFDLFWSHNSPVDPLERISNRTMIIDIHKMPVLKELVAYLVIERLYKEMISLPDSQVKDGRRTIRTILVIDEAHNYLCQKNIFLQRIIREGRSKGVVVFFASQSPSDYQQKFFDFQELLEFSYIFQCQGTAAKDIQDILGCSAKTAKDLQTEVARLEPFQVIARGMNKTDEFVKFKAEAFYKNY